MAYHLLLQKATSLSEDPHPHPLRSVFHRLETGLLKVYKEATRLAGSDLPCLTSIFCIYCSIFPGSSSQGKSNLQNNASIYLPIVLSDTLGQALGHESPAGTSQNIGSKFQARSGFASITVLAIYQGSSPSEEILLMLVYCTTCIHGSQVSKQQCGQSV